MPLKNGAPSCEEVKKIDLVDYLGSLGHNPAKIKGRNYWYCSPLPGRDDHDPSFKIDRLKNEWYDHGIGQGGTIIDFGIMYFDCTIGELLEKFRGNMNLPHIETTIGTTINHTVETKVTVLKVSSIQSPTLIYYLKDRKIPFSLATKYLKQVEFLIKRTYIALGFLNNSGGYELRNSFIKVSSSPKDSTLTKNGARKLAVFEGWPDWLSFLAIIMEQPMIPLDYLSLNSLAFFNAYLPVMLEYDEVFLYFDHNKAGREATGKALTISPIFTDGSAFYLGYEDINYWHTHTGSGFTRESLKGI